MGLGLGLGLGLGFGLGSGLGLGFGLGVGVGVGVDLHRALPLQAPAGDTASAHAADRRGSELLLLVYQLAKPRGRVLGVQCTLADGCSARLVRRRERGEQLVLGKEPGWGSGSGSGLG